ncbi:MAG TPA: BMP family ABC transporter substrate-binding protein [Acidimicrobiales bacterium]|jgi:simple sugar transport system substrate-binding protein/basic membrane protein A|nr:BMP family ABC transporter substrate-binding protein [Acidimicrobiales bacterium]
MSPFPSSLAGRRLAGRRRPRALGLVVSALVLVAAACGSSAKSATSGSSTTAAGVAATTGGTGGGSCTSPAGTSGPGVGASTVGFIYVGATTDFGYNEAAHAGEQALKAACPNIKFLEADEIPETSNMVTVANQMIGQGAKIIFSTSYGYEPYAVTLAKANPTVAFLQQGNLITPPVAPNINTYFGDVWQTVYLGGMAAAKASTSGKLGFVAAFPIPQTIVNIDAFELGAQSVNPKVTTTVVFTGAWCDPAMQAQATTSLLGQGVDVMTQHQDCTSTVIKTAEAAGAYTVGYHYDAQSLAPKGWLTGSEWNWGPLYTAMVKSILAGTFSGGPFNTNYTLGFTSTTIPSPLTLAPFGPSVSGATKALIDTAKGKIQAGTFDPFTGPITDQAGTVRIPGGQTATADQLSAICYLVKGVIGTVPSCTTS